MFANPKWNAAFSYKKLLRTLWRTRPHYPIPWKVTTGLWMRIYPDEEGWAFTHSYERKIVDFVKSYVQPGMVCVDVGAAQGFYTLLFLSLVGKSGKVLAFEPCPSQVKKLLKNLKRNKYKTPDYESAEGVKYMTANWVLNQSAVGASYRSDQILAVPRGQESRSSVGPLPTEVRAKVIEPISVRTVDLDNFVKSRVHLIKIDAEGAERAVLEGARKLILSDQPIVILEVADVTTQQFGYKASELVETMYAYGYFAIIADKGDLGKDGTFRDTYVFAPREALEERDPFGPALEVDDYRFPEYLRSFPPLELRLEQPALGIPTDDMGSETESV